MPRGVHNSACLITAFVIFLAGCGGGGGGGTQAGLCRICRVPLICETIQLRR